MKLYPLSYEYRSKVMGKIRRVNKGITKEIFVNDIDATIDSLIILANGHRDDIVVGILSKHLDGRKIVGLAKSERTRTSSIKNLPRYLSLKLPLKNFVFIMDQEDDSIEKIHSDIEREIKKICDEVKNIETAPRYFIYDCKVGGRKIKLIFIINGLDYIPTEKHSIEDHLVWAAEKLGFITYKNYGNRTSKEVWSELAKSNISADIYKRLFLNKNFAKEIFNQHSNGLRFIEE